MGDYYSAQKVKGVYTPTMIDWAFAIDSQLIHDSHQRGYLMMELIPANSAGTIFKNTEFLKWEYIKPYLIAVAECVLLLFKNRYVMTDLKLDNTLFDTDRRQASLIDLGGML
jgi:serine/threonine protein kinase